MDDHRNEPPNTSARFGNECYRFGRSLSRNPATDTTQTKSCRFENIHPQTHDVPLASNYVYNFEDMDNPGHYKLWFVHGAYTEWITSSLAPHYFSDFLEGRDHWGRGTQPTRWIQGATDEVRDFNTHPKYTALRLSVKDLIVKTGRPNSVSRGVHMSMLFDKDPLWVDRLIPSIPNMTLQEQEVREFDVYSAVQPPVETPLPPTNDHPSCMQLPLATCPHRTSGTECNHVTPEGAELKAPCFESASNGGP